MTPYPFLQPGIAATACLLALGIATSHAELLYGVDSGNHLLTFDSANPGIAVTSISISGLGTESVRSIDVRPKTGEVYAYSTGNRLFRIDPHTGAGTVVPLTFPSGSVNSPFQIGMDFQWKSDQLRILDGQRFSTLNNRVDPDVGTFFPPTPGRVSDWIGNIAYGTQLSSGGIPLEYGITFASIANATGAGYLSLVGGDAGNATKIGALGHTINTSLPIGFDISLGSGVAYASFAEAGGATKTGLYEINLATGQTKFLGNTPGDYLVGLATTAVPEPSTWGLATLGTVLLGVIARRRYFDS